MTLGHCPRQMCLHYDQYSLFVSDEGAGHVSVKMTFSVFTHVHNWTSHKSYFLGSFKIKNHSVSNLHPHTDLCRVVSGKVCTCVKTA